MILKVMKLQPDAVLPVRNKPTDAGADLSSNDEYILYPGEVAMISTGISVEIPENYMGMACSRSGHGKIKVRLANSVGIIDHEYRGELKLLVENEGSNTFNITKHMRIAQLVIVPVALPMFEVFEGAIEEWQNTSRGASGFGSSGS